jgi:hypothetical protein
MQHSHERAASGAGSGAGADFALIDALPTSGAVDDRPVYQIFMISVRHLLRYSNACAPGLSAAAADSLTFPPVSPPVTGLLWRIYRPVTVLFLRILSFLYKTLKIKVLTEASPGKRRRIPLFCRLKQVKTRPLRPGAARLNSERGGGLQSRPRAAASRPAHSHFGPRGAPGGYAATSRAGAPEGGSGPNFSESVNDPRR